VYSKVIPYTKFEHFGSFVFELYCGQTDKQTNSKILSTPAWVMTSRVSAKGRDTRADIDGRQCRPSMSVAIFDGRQ